MLPSPTTPETESVMEGTLWKWTNYLSGWQPRWFVLDGGCLSYFLSPNEVHLGSRGSLKISSCDILVHPSDHQRMDMVMPGGRHIYLRAASKLERQQWLLALGVAKQGGLDLIDAGSRGTKSGHGSALRKKMSDLHSNCQLLVSQIASIQTMTSDSSKIDSEVLSGLSSDVTVTCDKFLSALNECMELSLSTQHLSSSLKPLPLMELYAPKKGGGLSPVTKMSGFSEADLYPVSALPQTTQLTTKQKKTTPTTEKAALSVGKPLPSHLLQHNSGNHVNFEKKVVVHEGDGAGGTDMTAEAGSNVSQADSGSPHTTSDFFLTPTSSPQLTPPLSRPSRIGDRVNAESAESGRRHETFFSSLSSKFQDVELLEGEELIPTEQFLQCCQNVLPFFDTLSATAFAPVKADINGNIKKLSVKYSNSPDEFATLQGIVKSELEKNSHETKNSATDALLWLKRAMEFVQHFIAEVADGEHSLDVAAGKAYGLSLRRYHNWIVRGVFNLAMKAVPYHKDFLQMLGSLGTDEGEQQVTADMAVFAASLGELVQILNQFYHEHHLDPLPAQ